MNGPRNAELEAEIAGHSSRRSQLAAQFGEPGQISASDALALAHAGHVPVDPTVTADQVWASIYRDAAAADGWLESNLASNGHPALAKVPLPDGRVIGILDLRPALARAAAEGSGDG